MNEYFTFRMTGDGGILAWIGAILVVALLISVPIGIGVGLYQFLGVLR